MVDLGTFPLRLSITDGKAAPCRCELGLADTPEGVDDHPVIRITNVRTGAVRSIGLYGASTPLPGEFEELEVVKFGAFAVPRDGSGFDINLPIDLAEKIFELDPRTRKWGS